METAKLTEDGPASEEFANSMRPFSTDRDRAAQPGTSRWLVAGGEHSRVSYDSGSGIGSCKRTRSCMPVHRRKDSKGPYYQWGDSGKKYHYTAGDEKSRDAAKEKAKKQGRAARASGYKE